MDQSQFKNFVLPRVYLMGYTTLNLQELERYLVDTDQVEFMEEVHSALAEGLNLGEILCSFYAKACYASLTNKKNKNITKTRAIKDNIASILESGHGSVIEHCSLNFMVTNCSRIFTHEQVRHRVGTAYSQTSGRYVRSDVLNVVIDPILEPAYDLIEEARFYLQSWYKRLEQRMGIDQEKSFAVKKKKTSAMRRMLPNGQANEIGITENLRTLRQCIEARTSEHAEWEIRAIYNSIYHIVNPLYPAMFVDATSETVDGLLQVKFKNKKI